MTKQPETVAAAELQQFAAQYNAAAEEKAKAAERMAEIMGEAKGADMMQNCSKRLLQFSRESPMMCKRKKQSSPSIWTH